jgi:hypothetical protein
VNKCIETLPVSHRHHVNVVVPEWCPVDQRVHVEDVARCIAILYAEDVQLVLTLACGCPLIAVRLPSFDGLVA